MGVPFLDLKAQYATIKDEVLAGVASVFDDQAFVLGKYVEAFEAECAKYLGVKHAIGVSNGSDALLISLMAAGIQPGDEVIVPAFTFFATAGAVARLNAKPMFCDVHEDSFNIDLKSAAAKVTKKTRAIIPVDLYGQCADMEGVLDLARAGGDVKAVVSLHGLFGAPGNTAGRKISARVLCLHGYDDPMAQPPAMLELASELSAAGADWQIHAYGNTVHAFTNPAANNPDMGTVYSELADKRSRVALLNFLQEVFS